MTSSLTQYSSLIDVTFPIPGEDNDTQGFRDNYIQITQAFNTAASEITNLQITQADLLTQLNNATVVGTNYAANIASTVTTQIINSLTNGIPDIVTPIVNTWWINTSKSYIDMSTATLQIEITGLQDQINTTTSDISALQTQAATAINTGSILWSYVGILQNTSSYILSQLNTIESNYITVNNSATVAYNEAYYVSGEVSTLNSNVIGLQSTASSVWNTLYGVGNLGQNITTINGEISTLQINAINTSTRIAALESSVGSILNTYTTVTNTATQAYNNANSTQAALTAHINISPYYAASSPPITAKGSPGDRQGYFYADTGYIYICLASYTGSTNIWVRSVTTSSW